MAVVIFYAKGEFCFLDGQYYIIYCAFIKKVSDLMTI